MSGTSRRSLLPVRRVPLVSLVLFACCLAATGVAAWLFDRFMAARDAERFRNVVEATVDRIRTRVDAYVAVLTATRALFAADETVTAVEFGAFVRQLELGRQYPGIQGVGFSLRVPEGGTAAVERTMRAQGQGEFRVWPAEPRPEVHAILFLEPLDDRNRAALGFDMSTEEVRREAMARARDGGRAAASGRVTLVQEIDEHKQPGFLIYLPVYRGGRTPATVAARREALVGFTYSPFRMHDLLAGVFGSEDAPRVGFEIFDGAVRTPEHRMYRSPGFAATGGALVRASATIAVAGRTWSLRLRSEPTFDQQSGRRLGPWVLAGGIALSLVTFVVSIGRSRARERLRLQGRMLESMTEGVSVSDEHGTIVWTNPAEDRIFGWPPGGLIGRNVSEQNAYPPEESRRRVAAVIAELRARGVWTGEFENVRADGTRFVTAARISALDVGGKPYWVCVQEDVTDRKRAEAERQALLAREHAAREQAETASRAKDDFLAMLGHELRNPLAPIVTVLHVLRMRDQGKTRELEIIERQVLHLIRLVDDLLDVSRITRGKIQLAMQPLALERIVAQAVEMASPLLEQRRHRLTVEVASDCVVEGDAHRLAQVVANLLTNAAKYTEPGGRVEVRAARGGDAVVLRVRDDGIGIAPELLPRIFDLFTQGRRAMDRSEGGLGIGLALVRSLVEAHGGRVEAESAGLGCGSEFIVRLPVRGSGGAEAGAATAPAAAPSPGARRILLVDDNADAAESLAALLRAVGHEVVVALDGPRALAAVRDWRPDVAVLDLGLPVMDGFELAGRLRDACAPRLIALTGYGQPRDKARARAAGFAVHLVKPVDPATLLAAIAGDEPAVRTGS